PNPVDTAQAHSSSNEISRALPGIRNPIFIPFSLSPAAICVFLYSPYSSSRTDKTSRHPSRPPLRVPLPFPLRLSHSPIPRVRASPRPRSRHSARTVEHLPHPHPLLSSPCLRK